MQKSVCATNFRSFGEIGAKFSLQLSSRTQFAKIDNKKVIAENQCKNIKNRVYYIIMYFDTHRCSSQTGSFYALCINL